MKVRKVFITLKRKEFLGVFTFFTDNRTNKEIAKTYRVLPNTVYLIKTYRIWRA
jgi:hypothetical protein